MDLEGAEVDTRSSVVMGFLSTVNWPCQTPTFTVTGLATLGPNAPANSSLEEKSPAAP